MQESKKMILDKPIVAIDFDGTITCGDTRVWVDGVSTNDIFVPRQEVVEWVLENRESFYLILWTCRYGVDLLRALNFCCQLGINFDKVNENLVKYPTSNKIMADYYLDDKGVSPQFLGGITW